MNPEHDPRLAAVRSLTAVLADGQAFDPDAVACPDPRDRGLARAVVFGVLRFQPLLAARLQCYLRKPLKSRDADLQALLLSGLFQLGWMDTPAHAAVDRSVETCRALGKGWATGLVNGVLRAFQRDGAPDTAPHGSPPHVAAAHPQWLYERLAAAWPGDLDALCTANNVPGPLWLRLRGDPGATAAALAEAGHPGRASPHVPSALRLDAPAEVAALPGFDEGRVSVQDAAAQLAAPLLAPEAGQRVLDACAAPGGKTGHLLEREPALRLTALDVDPGRCTRIDDNLRRLGLEAAVVTGDARRPADWWDGEPFDRILLDAPCSGSGVIRRHPDIKVLRRPQDIAALAGTQGELLTALWPLLAEGGRLLYATCSVLPAEGEAVIDTFLAATPGAVARPIPADWGRPSGHGRQVLTGEEAMDGFYYALLEKG